MEDSIPQFSLRLRRSLYHNRLAQMLVLIGRQPLTPPLNPLVASRRRRSQRDPLHRSYSPFAFMLRKLGNTWMNYPEASADQ